MEKRLPLALFLSMLVLFGWYLIYPKPPEPRAEGTDAAPAAANAPLEPSGKLAVPTEPEPPALADDVERELVLEVGSPSPADGPIRPGHYRARFTNRGAKLLELDLADFVRHAGLDEAARGDPANWMPLIEPIATAEGTLGSLVLDTGPSSKELAPDGLADVLWTMEELAGEQPGVLFRYGPPGGRVFLEKRVTFEPGTWHVHLELTLQNVDAGAGGRRDFALVPAGCVVPELGDTFYPEPRAVAIGRESPRDDYEIDSQAAPKLKRPGALEVASPLAVGGVHNKYFAFLLREEGPTPTMWAANYRPVFETGRVQPRNLILTEVTLGLRLPDPGSSETWKYVVYAGPKARADFEPDFPPHELVLENDISGELGRAFQVDHIARGLLAVLRFFHGLVGNWGLSIILMTLCVRAALFPLNRRAQTSMARYQKKMKRVQPRLEEVKKRYENDPQKLREAQAKIMQEEGAFPPLGGCLPVFLQMPVFFGLFSALRTSFDLRQAPFYGWIDDLSLPDRLLELGLKLPLLPDIHYLNVLPILMVVLWLLQQSGMPLPADEQAARMQKMMRFMPVIFGVMLYNYAAGLSLYMMTTSSLSIIEQKVIKKLWPIDDTEVVKAKKGCGPFSGVMEHLAEKHREQMKRMQAMQAETRRVQAKRKKR